MESLAPAKFRGIQHGVIVTVCEGKGEQGNPYREVHYLYTADLRFLGSIDPWRDQEHDEEELEEE